MSPEEFRELLADLGMSQNEIARQFGANVTTVRRWATGEKDIPVTAQLLLHLMRDNEQARRFIETYAMGGR